MSERDLIAELREQHAYSLDLARASHEWPPHDGPDLLAAAADELERLAERADRYEKALRLCEEKLATLVHRLDDPDWNMGAQFILWSMARTAHDAAQVALAGPEGEGNDGMG